MEEEEWGDPGDDDAPAPLGGLPCPPTQRTWRHPSELEPTLAMPVPGLPPDQVSRSTVLLITLLGAACAVGLALLVLPQGGTEVTQLSSTATPVTTQSFVQPGTAGWLGATVVDRDGDVLVSEVTPGSPAEQAGLAPGDTVLEVDGAAAATSLQLTEWLHRCQPGTAVHLAVRRGGTRADVDVTLTTSP